MGITEEQKRAIESEGKTIVSASAGSGKTFVMINKLVSAIENGADLDEVLAVTFTKKAACQMKDKLREKLIEAIKVSDGERKSRLKTQLGKIRSESISTIHAFCAKIVRTYFYIVGAESSFEIIPSDDRQAAELKNGALDSLFERYYAEDNAAFLHLLKCYRKKRGDKYLREIILSAYSKLRENAGYKELLESVKEIYTEDKFNEIALELNSLYAAEYMRMKEELDEFALTFKSPSEGYSKILDDMRISLENASRSGIFAPRQVLTSLRKPADRTEEDRLAGEKFKKFKENLTAKFKKVKEGLEDENTERERFFKSGVTACALAEVLTAFDAEYAAAKADSNKLDYNDLEHYALKILNDERVKGEINYKYVFVDEYQDVNPVQEQILSLVGGENAFYVGDVKQAIYGFRGSKSKFFSDKYSLYKSNGGNALKLSKNFRSSDGVLGFVNGAMGEIMTGDSCGTDYKKDGVMQGGGGYPAGYGETKFYFFGSAEEEKKDRDVYSVLLDGRLPAHSREGLAVLEIVSRELKSKHYDLDKKDFVDTQCGDICILTRKHNEREKEIIRTLSDAGYPIAGAEEGNIFDCPEVREIYDILSYLDNAAQDVPLATALLSPLGGFTCDELANIRLCSGGSGRDLPSFCECCKKYAARRGDGIAVKLNGFYRKTDELRDLCEILSGAEIVDKILETVYAGGGAKLKNIRRLAAEGEGVSLKKMLSGIKDGGFKISLPPSASSDSIKIMTMHSSKGLEFPVVIISDICATFKGKERNPLPFDEKYFFAPQCFDIENRLVYPTLLKRLEEKKADAEELKNEYNLFYVACTRAMCNLHILAKEKPEFIKSRLYSADCYADMFDLSGYPAETVEIGGDVEKKQNAAIIVSPDPVMKSEIAKRFGREYAFKESVNLPVKSSASAILKLYGGGETLNADELFGGEGETNTDIGIAYHRFLELCDFTKKEPAQIEAEINKFLIGGGISAGQSEILDINRLSEILKMPAFDGLENMRVYREREFLCRLPAKEILDTDSNDEVLVQGAIDLLAETKDGYKIIDYKYSGKSDLYLAEHYSAQLNLYRKAVAKITHTDINTVSAVIVNLLHKRQIVLK